jgi:hypothetical protein
MHLPGEIARIEPGNRTAPTATRLAYINIRGGEVDLTGRREFVASTFDCRLRFDTLHFYVIMHKTFLL